MIMKIGIGSDHGGFELKEYIKEYLEKEGIEYVDYGTNSSDSVDYPDYGLKLSTAVVEGEVDKGIAICGTGIGISIACNKVKGIRCALCGDTYSARMSIEHNNANILALGGRVIGRDLAIEIVNTWLNAKFEGGRHKLRIDKITDIEG
jgi:ribose 5-phosphate isomerase B